MNEVEYILRIVLKARDELASALAKARTELRGFARDAEANKSKIDAFNTSMENMSTNVDNITDKLREWRTVLQGSSDDIGKTKKSFDDLGKGVEAAGKRVAKTADEQEKARAVQDKLLKSADKLREEYRKLDTQEARNDKNRSFTLARLKYIGQELDRISKKVADPDIQRFYHRWAQDSKRLADSITADHKQMEESAKQLVKTEEDVAAKRKSIIERDRAARAAFTRARAVTERLGGKDVSAIDKDEAEQTVKALREVAKGYEGTSRSARNLRVTASNLSDTLRSTGKDAESSGGFFSRLSDYMDKNRDSVASLDNTLRGIGWLLAAGFAQQLITVLGGLGGAFVAVAASAAQAGAAIGGAFVAGIAQALPAIGLLGAAMARVSSVMDVVKQAQTAQQQAAVQGATANRRTADSADSVRNAQDGLRSSQESLRDSHESLADAQRRLGEAQAGVAEARQEARRDLEDLIQAERQADLAARGAVLSQQEAQEQLRLAIAGGDVAGIARAELNVLESQVDAEEKLTAARRTRQEVGRARRGGVEGMEGVQDAKDAAEDAERGVADARRGIENAERAVARASRGIQTARRNASEAAAGTQTAAATLNYLLAQLSPAERRLYQALTNIQEAYKKTYRPITDLIIDSFTRSVKGVQRIMLMPEVISMARRTAQQISRQLNRIFDAFTTGPMIDQFLRIAEEGRKNLVPLSDIVISLGKSFFNIAEAAGPSLSLLLDFIKDLADEFEAFTGDTDKLEEFFITGEEHFEAWIKLGLAVIRLFMALGGAGGAQTGLDLVNDATKAINGLIRDINDNKGAVADFFSDSRGIVHEVVGVVVELAKALHSVFTPERVEAFADLIKTILIPALVSAIEFMGNVSNFLLRIADTPVGKNILQFGVALFLVQKIVGSTIGVLFNFFKALSPIATGIFNLVKHLPKVARLVAFFKDFGALRLIGAGTGIGLIVTGIVLLLDKLGLLDEVWDEIMQGFGALWGQVQPPLERFIASFEDLWAAISDGKGAFAALEPVLRVLIEIGGFLLESVFKAIGQVLGGLIDIIGGFMDIITGALTGDFSKVWEGVKDIVRGALNLIIGLFQLFLFRGLGSVFRLGLRGLAWVGKSLWELFWNALKGIPRLIGWAVENGSNLAIRFLSRLPGRIWNIVQEIAKFFWRGFQRLGPIVRNAIEDAWGFLRRLPGRIWDLARTLVTNFWRGFRRISRVIREAIEDAWAWLRRLPGRMWELAKDLVARFWRGYQRIGGLIRKGIDDAWDWIKGLPKRLGDIAVDAAKAFGNAFKDLGKVIIDAIGGGVRGAGEFAKNIVKGVFGLINSGWNRFLGGKEFGVSPLKFTIPRLNLRLAKGGPVPGAGRGDKVQALLEPGEHVWTAEEVKRAGGHAAMFALRKAFGGGGQSAGGSYQRGGAAQEGAGAGSITIHFEGGKLDDFASVWRRFWSALVVTARRGTKLIEEEFRDLRVNSTKTMARMYRDVREVLEDINANFRLRGRAIVNSWEATWMSLKKVSYEGLDYIAHETNKALKGMGEKIIHFGLSEPKKADNGKAGGGWIGGRGQRGKDVGFYALGAGEAVLNWQHQRYVEPAMNAFYGHGLSDMFARTRGYHAGGPEQPGFARGRLPDVLGAKPGFGVFMQLFRRLAGNDVYVMSGSRPGSITTSGNVSNHSAGNAIDISNIISQGGSPGNPPPRNALDNLHKWISTHIPAPPRLDFLWRTTTGGNHYNHIHMGLDAAVTASIAAARNYIKKNLGEKFGSLVGAFDPIKKRLVTPKDLTLSKLVQKSLDKVLKAANKMIEETFPDTGDYGGKTGDYSGGVISAEKFGGIVKQALNILNIKSSIGDWVRTMTRQAMHESTLNPQARNDSAAGRAAGGPKGILQVVDGTFAAYKHPGRNDVFNPLDNTLASIKYVIDRYGNGNPDAAVDALWARGGGAYARGGEIPGPDGAPVPILAHAREWILNLRQQQRIANMLGLGREGLRAMLGFHGKGGTAQGGTEAAPGAATNVKYTTEYGRERIERLRRGIYELPVLPLFSWESVVREAKRAFLAINRRGRALSLQVRDLNDEIKELEKGDETKAEKEKIKKLKAERKALIEGGTMVKEIAAVNKEIEKLQKGDEDRKQRREIAKLVQERRQLQRRGRAEVAVAARIKALQALTTEGGIIDQMDAARERFSATIARRLTFATFKFNRTTRRVTQRLDDVDQASKELENSRRDLRRVIGEEGVITKALKNVNRRLRQLRRGGISEAEAPELRQLEGVRANLRERRITIRDAHAAALERVFQAQLDRQQKIVDEINTRAERSTTANELQRRMGEALGDEGLIGRTVAAQREILTGQANELERRIAAARRIGATDLANQLTDQVADLRMQIFESIQQELRDAADRINTRAQRRLGAIDLAGRALDAFGAVGLGGIRGLPGRGDIFGQRTGVLQQQRAELGGVLAGAQAQGNIALIEELTDQIAELDVTIQENTKAYFDARVEDMNARAGYSLQVNDLTKRIAELKDTASGQINQARLLTLAQERTNILTAQRVEIEALLAEAIRDQNQQAMNDLNIALLENEIALLENTAAIDEMNGTMRDPQTFTSSAWTWFREAIFTGMGQVLPQYDIGNMGGVNTGAVVYPSVSTSSTTSGDTNIILNEAGRPPDLTEISSVVTFASKTAQ